jgi:AraC-like DNA-binding protein
MSSARNASRAADWREISPGCQALFGNVQETGYQIEWHDFFAQRRLDWAESFRPDALELCLNVAGNGFVATERRRATFSARTAGFYVGEAARLSAERAGGEQHRFLTLEFSPAYLAKHLSGSEETLHPIARAALEGRPGKAEVGTVSRLSAGQQQLVASLRHPPVYAAAQPVWYHCKALELAVTFLFQPPTELFCTRQQRLAHERVEHVIFLLKKNLAEPPSLEELGREIGCSHFYLSRIFSTQTGRTITQYLRELRMEKAAELLRSGEYNVTETALEVGYSSPSHFSQAFHETFGCCPGLYPIGLRSVEKLKR